MQDTPKNLDQKCADEKMLVSEMIALYCRRQHKTPKGSLCPECRQRMLPVHPVLSIRHVAVTLRSMREAKKTG